jgi:hypothetical protein
MTGWRRKRRAREEEEVDVKGNDVSLSVTRTGFLQISVRKLHASSNAELFLEDR